MTFQERDPRRAGLGSEDDLVTTVGGSVKQVWGETVVDITTRLEMRSIKPHSPHWHALCRPSYPRGCNSGGFELIGSSGILHGAGGGGGVSLWRLAEFNPGFKWL